VYKRIDKMVKKVSKKVVKSKKISYKDAPTLQIKKEEDIATDFAVKAYKKFDKLIKSAVLFGSVAKGTMVPGSDIDIVIILDDASVKWDQELIAWYREELEKLIKENPYHTSLHINTIKLTTWWEDLMRGDPVVINIIRNGEPILDMGGFFTPLKYLLVQGRIKPTPEAIYTCLQRAPTHFGRSKIAELNSIEGLYWAMVDSGHAALIAANVLPPSPEHIPGELKLNFVDQKKLNMKYVMWFREVLDIHKKIMHGEVRDLKGEEIDSLQEKTQDFIKTMAELINDIVEKK